MRALRKESRFNAITGLVNADMKHTVRLLINIARPRKAVLPPDAGLAKIGANTMIQKIRSAGHAGQLKMLSALENLYALKI